MKIRFFDLYIGSLLLISTGSDPKIRLEGKSYAYDFPFLCLPKSHTLTCDTNTVVQLQPAPDLRRRTSIKLALYRL
ncbi:hypothetical protein QVD17_22914 [Tagetes erecta]|uniref:Uncharacterized protein n=1 Tax=Tagetes erecta TaxID=13708 RepID=A0AAD8KE00_TARER|nr:hypothetical protein QVD17_22914 [Tagetes erecta]